MKLKKMFLTFALVGIVGMAAGIGVQTVYAEESDDYYAATQTEKWDGYDTTVISTGGVLDEETDGYEGEIITRASGNRSYVSITEDEAYDAIWAMAEEYPEGMPWTNDNGYWSYNMGGGYGCHGFALIVSDRIFEQNASRRYTDYRLLRVGDVLRINNNTHTVVVLENHLDERYIVVTEGNYNYSIHWGRRISVASLDAGFVYGYTRYVDDNREKVLAFARRMYEVVLERTADKDGLKTWTDGLVFHELDGAGVANGFIMSDEFRNKKVSDEAYVDILYRTFFDREADAGGRADWLEKLANGNSRSFVLAGFVNSVEFDDLCNRYGIVRGTMQTNETAIGSGVRQFVERCYNKVLGRDGETAGIEDWTGRIARGEETPESVAKLFFFSDEYTLKNTDNETFVETLYQTFMGRDSDRAGKSDWVGRLNNGTSREEVLEGFSRSAEFAGILEEFGL